MTLPTEIYRQFLLTGLGAEARLMYAGPAEAAPPPAETEQEQPEAEESPEQKAEDRSDKIEDHKRDVLKKIQEQRKE